MRQWNVHNVCLMANYAFSLTHHNPTFTNFDHNSFISNRTNYSSAQLSAMLKLLPTMYMSKYQPCPNHLQTAVDQNPN